MQTATRNPTATIRSLLDRIEACDDPAVLRHYTEADTYFASSVDGYAFRLIVTGSTGRNYVVDLTTGTRPTRRHEAEHFIRRFRDAAAWRLKAIEAAA